MRALAIVHQPDAGSGLFADEMRDRGVRLDEWPLSMVTFWKFLGVRDPDSDEDEPRRVPFLRSYVVIGMSAAIPHSRTG